ncbi:MAG: MucBP domain-containing protein, partial [Clostridia bacterium]|nr:MucBP domain-containing protein [Clostridia bacterium]
NASGIYTEETQVITYYYEVAPVQLIVHHYIDGTEDSVAPDVTSEAEKGSEYTTSPVEYPTLDEKYELVTTKLPENASGTLEEAVTEVTYYYAAKEYEITTEVDGEGGTISGEGQTPYETVIYKENSVNNIIITLDEGYQIKSITINGVEQTLPENKTSSYTLDKFTSVTEDKHIVVTFELAPVQLIVHHYLDGTETSVAPDVITEGQKGDVYTTEPVEYPTLDEKYELVESKWPENDRGVLENAVTEVIYYYTAKEYEITTEVDGEGGTISGQGQTPYETVIHGENSVNEIKIVPNEGYVISSVTINGQEQEITPNTDRSYTLPIFESVKEDKHVVVKFVKSETYNLDIEKIDRVNNTAMSNIEFTLSNMYGEKTYTTNSEGKINLESLYVGIEYTLKETTYPDGYVLNKNGTKFVAEINSEGNIEISILEGEEIVSVEKDEISQNSFNMKYYNDVSLVIEKKNADGTKVLENAKFIIKKINEDGTEEDAKDGNGNTIGTVENINGTDYRIVKTDERGIIGINLPAGKYKAIEVEAPEGYALPENVDDRTYEFEITIGQIVKEIKLISSKDITSNSPNPVGILNTSDGGYIEYGGVYDGLTIAAEDTVANQEIVVPTYEKSDGILIKYNSNGLVEWVKVISSDSDSNNLISDLDQNSDGSMIGIGIFIGTITIPADQTVSGEQLQITSTDATKEYIIKFDKDMKVEWIRSDSFAYLHSSFTGSIESYDDGSYMVNIAVNGTLTIPAEKNISGVEMIIETNNTGMVAIKYNSNGIIEFASEVEAKDSSGGSGEPVSLAESRTIQTYSLANEIEDLYSRNSILTSDGSKIEVGYIYGTVNISSDYTVSGKEITLTPNGDYSGYIIKYNSEGKIEWAKLNNSIGEDGELSLVREADDGFVAVGYFVDGINFSADETLSGEEMIIENNGFTSVIMKYSKDGLLESAKIIEDIYYEAFWDENVDLSINEDIYYVTDYSNSKTYTYKDTTTAEIGVKEQVKLDVKNELKEYKITTEVDGEGGVITGEGETPYETVVHGENSVKDIIVTPDAGYKITSITVNGEPITFTPDSEDNYTLDKFVNMTEDKHIVVKFEKKDTSIIVKHQTEDGTDLVDPETVNGKVGDTYTTTEKDFEDYEIKTIPDNANGTMTEEQIEVIYVYSLVKGKITVTKVDINNTDTKLSGATFKLEKLDDNGNVDTTFTAQEKTTGSAGTVEFSELLVGKYQITETKAPEGYELNSEITEVDVTKANKELNVTVKNREKLVLPETGEVNYIIVTSIIGIVLMTSAIIGKKLHKN